MENEIIEADYREISADGENLTEITAEIKYITGQMQRMLISAFIEIGKRFEKAKLLVKHGEWGKYCEECTGYSQSMAENYIKIYHEYGGEQGSLFGDLSKSQSLGNLGVTKLIELIAVPADEREKFVEENNVSESTTVKELRELINRQKADFSAERTKAEERARELELSLGEKQAAVESARSEIERLSAELAKRNSEERGGVENDMDAMIAEAEENARKSLEEDIKKLEKEKSKAAAEADKLKEKLEKLQDDYDKQSGEVKELSDKNSAAAAEKEELQKTIDRLQNESSFGASENMVKLNLCFEAAQESLSAMKKSLAAVRDSEKYDALRHAVCATLSAMIEEME